jgi:hypothetical protein
LNFGNPSPRAGEHGARPAGLQSNAKGSHRGNREAALCSAFRLIFGSPNDSGVRH